MAVLRSPHEVLADCVPLGGRDVVDVGCGDGTLVRWLTGQGARAVGVESSPAALERARSAAPVADERYLAGVAQALPLPDASADAVVFQQSLHHVPASSLDVALAEAARVVRRGGVVYIQEPLPEGAFFDLVRVVDDETEVRALAQAAIGRAGAVGLEVEREVRFDAPVRLAGFDAVHDRLTLAADDRRARFADHEAALRARFAGLGEPGPDGVVLRSPTLVHLLRRP